MTVERGRRDAATQIFVPADVLDIDGDVVLDDDTEHHLDRVLRLRAGERVSVSDGVGRWRLAEVVTASGSLRLVPVTAVATATRAYPPLTIATAIPKGDRVDWLVQKAVELGVDVIQFLHAERSAVRWKPDRATKHVDRLQRIALEAARQSRRAWLPVIRPPQDAATTLTGYVVAEPGGRSVAAGDSFVAIGPEGGWTSAELESAAEQVELGPMILRTETAVLAAVTLCVASYH